MGPLLISLESEGSGFMFQGNKITTLAFANDVAILSDSYQQVINNLQILNQYCMNTSLWINVKKTKGFHMVKT